MAIYNSDILKFFILRSAMELCRTFELYELLKLPLRAEATFCGVF